METKFTKGPWEVKLQVANRLVMMPDDRVEIHKSPRGGLIAAMYNGEEDRANAHLIAAAPVMYEALEDAEIALLINSDDRTALADALKVVTFALSKARGERTRKTPYDAPDETRDANAHLIAAAPDLYEALEELYRCTSTPSGPHNANIVTNDMRRAAQEATRAALSKARGE